MSKTTKVLSLIIAMCLIFIMSSNALADSSTTISTANSATSKVAKINVTKETMKKDEATGIITKTIEFTYEPETINQSSIQSPQANVIKSMAASGVLTVSLTPDYYSHSAEIDWTLSSSTPMYGIGVTTCLMDSNTSLTKIDRCVPQGTTIVYGQFNYYFGKAGYHICDVICNYVDTYFGGIIPTTGWIPFSV